MDRLPKSMPAHVPSGLRQAGELAAADFALLSIKRDIAVWHCAEDLPADRPGTTNP